MTSIIIISFLLVVALASICKMIDLKQRNIWQGKIIQEYAEEINRLREIIKEDSLLMQSLFKANIDEDSRGNRE